MNRVEPKPASDALIAALGRLSAIVGKHETVWPAEVESFGVYLHDETYLRGNADLVLRPGSVAEVCALVTELNSLRSEFSAEKDKLSFTLRGGGSGLSGACVPSGGIVLDLTRLNRIVDVDARNQVIRAESGAILSSLNETLLGSGLCYPVDPSSLSLCTVGGSIATNAAGPSSLKYGTTRHYLATAQFVNAAGDTTQVGALPVKTSMGFSLTDLLCGSEGRLGIVTEATLRLVRIPDTIALLMGSFPSEEAAVECMLALRAAGIQPRCVELIDSYSAALVDFPLAQGVVLMIELDGSDAAVSADIDRLLTVKASAEWITARDEKNRRDLWMKRKNISPGIKRRFAFRLGEDVAVPLTSLSSVCAFARRQAVEQGIAVAIWGHAGDGNLHVNYLLETADQLPKLDVLMRELAGEVTRVGGAMSGEHGLGRLKRKYARALLPAHYFDMQRNIKLAFDPAMLFNPALEID